MEERYEYDYNKPPFKIVTANILLNGDDNRFNIIHILCNKILYYDDMIWFYLDTEVLGMFKPKEIAGFYLTDG